MRKIILFLSFVINVSLHAQSVGGLTTGGAAYCDSINSGFISLSFQVGNVLNWETSIDNGNTWVVAVSTATTLSYNNVKQTTLYRAVVQNGSFAPATSSTSTVTIYPQAVGGNIVGAGDFCMSAPAGTLQLTGSTGTVTSWEYSTNSGSSWNTVANITTLLPHASISINTYYRAIVQNISICPSDTSNEALFNIFQNSVGGILNQSDTICFNDNIDTLKLTGALGTVIGWVSSPVSPTSWTNIGKADTMQFPYLNLTQSIKYRVLVKNGVCPIDTSSAAALVVINANTVTAGADKNITRYQSTTLDAVGNGTVTWQPEIGLSNISAFNPVASPLSTTEYTITLTDRHQCTSTDRVLVNVEVLIPSAITPNGDGMNDYFEIEKIESFPASSLTIYNRWGNVVFKEAPYKNKWNGVSNSGSALPDETYYYILDYGVGDKPLSGYVLIKR